MTAVDASLEVPLHRERGLRSMRTLYFLYFAAVGAYWTFINVYYRSIGLSGTEIGLVNTLPPLVAIFAATMWGMLNDRLGQARLVLRISVPGVILSALLLSQVRAFGWIVVMACLLAFFNSATIPLMDNTTLRLLGEERGHYGRYRVLGSVGFIIVSLGVGYIYEITGYQWIFYSFALIMGLFVLAASGLPNERVRLSGSVWGGLGTMVRQPAWLVFAISAFLLWISNNGTMAFIGIVVQGMGGSAPLIGLVWMASAVAEIPIMLTSDRLLKRGGPTLLISLAFVAFIVRAVLFALMPSPNWAPWVASLGGLAYSLFWMSAVTYANDSAPEHLKSTAQGLLFSLLNLAGMAGSLFSGWMYDVAGPRGLFWAMAAFATAGMVVFVVGRVVFRNRG